MCVIPYSSVFTTTAPQLEFQNFNIYYYYYYTYIRNHILLVGKNCMEVLLSRKMVQIKGFPRPASESRDVLQVIDLSATVPN